MLDVILTSMIVASIYHFLKFEQFSRKYDLVVSGVFIGLGVLTKSLIGFLPVVVIGIYYLIKLLIYKSKTVKFTDLIILGLISLLIALPWHLHMYQLHGDRFIDSYFGYHLFERFSNEIEDKGAPWDFYLVVIRNTMRVWFLILLPALVYFGYKMFVKKLPSSSSILVIASATFLLLFSASSSKLKWYIMPIYPFLYVIAGYFVFNIFNYLISKKINYQLVGLMVYSFIFLNLAYFYTVRDMVYTDDFNLRQASLLEINNSLPNVEMTYLDKIDYPIGLFYNEKKEVEFIQFSQLKEILPSRVNDKKAITIITGSSRFETLNRLVPELKVIAQNDDFVLASLNYVP